jgi:NAD(P)-dependent dehydrogenase (short-subunit alcohol dehydrogenase family)
MCLSSLTPQRSKGALIFSQAALPVLLQTASSSSAKYPPTLIFTGATASVKANAQMSSFASGKFALRALSTSIAKEFGPKGVHVLHAVIDGAIDMDDIPDAKAFLRDMPAEGKIEAGDIAETYWNLHTQGTRCFTNEIDIRPMLEKW